jgi:hypothetical protein
MSHAPRDFFHISNRGDVAIPLLLHLSLNRLHRDGAPWSLDAILARREANSALGPAE